MRNFHFHYRPTHTGRMWRTGIITSSLWVFFLVLAQPLLLRSETPSSAGLSEAERLANLKDQGRTFRENLSRLPQSTEADSIRKESDFQDAGRSIVSHRSQYYRLRESLFQLAFRHASAIVQTMDSTQTHQILVDTAMSLVAAHELIKNFHAVAAVLNERRDLRWAWNQAHPTEDIPPNSWERSLQTTHKTGYRDVLEAGLQRIQDHQDYLEQQFEGGDQEILTLFQNGIKETIEQVAGTYALLQVNLAEEHLRKDRKQLRTFITDSKHARESWINQSSPLRKAIARDDGMIRGEIRLQVYAAEKTYLDLRKNLYQLAFTHLPKLTSTDVPYPPDIRLQGIGLALLAAATLYENAQVIKTHVLTIPGVRALLNQGDLSRGIPQNFWNGIHQEFVNLKYRRLLEDGLETFDLLRRDPALDTSADSEFISFVHNELMANPIVVEIRSANALQKMVLVLGYYSRRMIDFFTDSLEEGKFQASRGFGNLMGVIELRKGKLYDQPHWEQLVASRLEPGDILLEKTPFRLTDTLIPGHFGHAALFIGTVDQLRELGLFEHPLVRDHVADISEGNTIIEALRDGTQLNTLHHFLNVDDLAILRPKRGTIPEDDIREAVTLGFSHIGKRYDFNFDTNTWDAIVCSELIFQTYVKVPWTFDRVLGSFTISPDDIAVFAGSDTDRPFSLRTFIHDGELIHDSVTGLNQETSFVRLLGKRYHMVPIEHSPQSATHKISHP